MLYVVIGLLSIDNYYGAFFSSLLQNFIKHLSTACEKPQPKPVAGRRVKQLRIRVKNLEARLEAFEECICKSVVLFSFIEFDSGRTSQWNFVDTV